MKEFKFTVSEKIKDLLKGIDDPLLSPIREETIIDPSISYLDISKEDSSKISYMTKQRFERYPDRDPYDPLIRYQGRPGKVFRKLFTTGASDSQIEQAVNKFHAVNCDDTFRIVKGEDIKYWYHEDNYEYDDNLGDLGESCMRFDECQRYLDMYAENPDVVSMVILITPRGTLIGRALLWTLKDGRRIMDRIYGSDVTIEKFKLYAKSKNFLYKRSQSCCSETLFMTPENEYSVSKELYFKIEMNMDFYHYPYVDTFYHTDSYSFVSNGCDGEDELRETDGRSSNYDRYEDEYE